MDWKRERSGMAAEGEESEIYYMILPKRNGKFYVKAYLAGGAEWRLPFQDFASEQEAIDWVEVYEIKLAEQKARRAAEEPISF